MNTTKKPKPKPADNICIKGTREGLVVAIGEGEWCELMNELTSYLQHEAAFFSGAQAILDAGPRELTTEDLRQLGQLFSSNSMEISGIKTSASKTAEAAAALEIPARTEADDRLSSVSRLHSDREPQKALFIKRTIRSGQMLRYPGHVTIVGDVNPGAEVVAGGDIIIWGKLRGTVHAGAQGDDSAIVCALSLAPTQLRIGNHISRSPEEGERNVALPETARVDQTGIIVEPWDVIRQ